MPSEPPTNTGFSEQSLRQAIVNTWGEFGAHADVFDHMLNLATVDLPAATLRADRAEEALERAMKVVEAAKTAWSEAKIDDDMDDGNFYVALGGVWDALDALDADQEAAE